MLNLQDATYEQRGLFNAAFCGTLINSAAKGHETVSGAGIPVILTYVALPVAMHQASREALPARANALMISWLHQNPQLLHDLPARVPDLRPFISAGLTLALRSRVIEFDELGNIRALKLKRRPSGFSPTSDWTECVKAAEFMGKWFAHSDLDVATTLSSWGFRP